MTRVKENITRDTVQVLVGKHQPVGFLFLTVDLATGPFRFLASLN